MDIKLHKWEVPADMVNRDQLECMLQVVQASLAKGEFSEGRRDCGSLTREEGKELIDSIKAKIEKLN